MSRGIEIIKAILQKVTSQTNYGQSMKCLKLISAGDGKCKVQFTVTEEHVNVIGSLHGGFSTTVADCVTSYALMTYQNSNLTGVSVDMHMMFLKGASVGETVTVDARTIRAGKKLAFLEAELTKNDGKEIIVRCQHTKYIGS